jgi:hypothetical protein
MKLLKCGIFGGAFFLLAIGSSLVKQNQDNRSALGGSDLDVKQQLALHPPGSTTPSDDGPPVAVIS